MSHDFIIEVIMTSTLNLTIAGLTGHGTVVGREVLTGELCAVQMDGGRLHVAF